MECRQGAKARGRQSVCFLITRSSAATYLRIMTWETIRLELAQTREHPGGSVSRGYLIHRIREALFGGTTRRLLEESPIPLFIAH